MSILDILLGKPLATSDERGEQVGVSAGIPIFGLDALSSAAYGPEAALTLLIPLGLAGVAHIVPISASIIVLLTIVVGISKTMFAGGHPTPVVPPPAPLPATTAVVGLWLLLQVFSNGCTAMTGVEAVSNGVRAFREPTVNTAQRALTVIIGLLIVLLAGIAYLVRAYGIAATDPGQPGYQSVLSMLVAAVAGRGWFYYVTIGSVLVILSLS